jgi:hemerythrin-like domain-containing protein
VGEAIGCLKEAASGSPAAAVALGNLVRTLADAEWRHISSEERTILPMARRHLKNDDWTEIADAFEGNNDPGFGDLTAGEFRRLFTRIANLLPAARASA